jgi:hypothetical protein
VVFKVVRGELEAELVLTLNIDIFRSIAIYEVISGLPQTGAPETVSPLSRETFAKSWEILGWENTANSVY